MTEKLRVLIVEDSEDDAILILNEMKDGGYDPKFERVETREAFLSALKKGDWDIIISDYTMPKFSGLDAVKLLKESGIDLPFILVSGTIGEEIAVKSLLAGAHDFILKGKWDRFIPAVKRELKDVQVRREYKKATDALRESEELFRTLSNAVPVGIYKNDAEGKCVFINEKCSKIIGLSMEEALGDGWGKNLHPDDRDRVLKEWNTAVKERTPFQSEYRFVHPDGKVIWVYGQALMEKCEVTPFSCVGTITDITEHKQAEDLTSRLGRILNNSSNEIYIFDSESFRFLQVNQGAVQNLGYTIEELKEMKVFDIKPEYNEKVFAELLLPLRSGEQELLLFLTIHRRKDGSSYPVEARIHLSSKETPPVFVAIIQDITERQKAEKAIKEKTNLLQLIYEITLAANEAVTVEDAIFICLSKVCKYTGWPVGHAYNAVDGPDGKPLLKSSNLWYIEDPKRFETFKKVTEIISFAPGVGLPGRVFKTKQPAWISDLSKDANFPRMDYSRLHKKDLCVRAGFAFPVQVREKVVSVLEFFSEKVEVPNNLLLEVASNLAIQLSGITERKQAEETLRKLNNAIEQTAEMVIISDSQGIIEYINPATEKISEYTREELIGRNLRIFSSGNHSRDFYKKMWDTINSGNIWKGNMINKKKSGELYDEEMTISPIQDNQGNIINFVAIKRDISREKIMQRQLIQSDKLASIGRLSAGVAHEIKNPLNVISTSIQLLEMGENVPEDALTRYKKIREQINRIVKITTNLRNFAREAKPETKEVNLNEFIDKTVALFDYEMKLENIVIEKKFTAGAINVQCDSDQMAQVFLNLIGNARDSMNEKQKKYGREELKASRWEGRLTIETSRENSWLHIRFQDTGMGMPDKTMKKIFDPFFTTKEEGKGTGLGLSIALGILENHGGSIKVESEEGKGTSFTITLPLSQKGGN